MPKGNNRGTILIGSAEAEVKSSLVDFVIASFDKHVLGVTETSDLLLEAIDNEVELAIIDTNLKGLPIAKTIQILKKSKPQVPVIVISDDYTVATGSRIMELGIFYYMYKPVDLENFKEIIESALLKRAREVAKERR